MTKSISEVLKQQAEITTELTTPINPANQPLASKVAAIAEGLSAEAKKFLDSREPEGTDPVIQDYDGEYSAGFNDSEKSPADWAIVGGVNDLVTATHRVTRKVFNGTVKQFSQALK